MRQIVLAGCLGLLLACGNGVAARAGGFLTLYDDLPLPPSVHEIPGSGVSFDTPTGRLVESYAQGPVNMDQTLRFYQDTLPQLGWTADKAPVAKGTFRWRRESETLQLVFKRQGRDLVLWFTISPE